MGVVGVVVVWASACDAVRTADEATSPNAAAYPRKASALRRQTCFGSERSLISGSRLPRAWHLKSVTESVVLLPDVVVLVLGTIPVALVAALISPLQRP